MRPDVERHLERALLERFKEEHPEQYELAQGQFDSIYRNERCSELDSQVSSRLQGRPRYEPAKWNNETVIDLNNCYAYANDRCFRQEWGANPGTGDVWMGTKDRFVDAVTGDGLRPLADADVSKPLPHNGWPIALFIRFDRNGYGVDSHFYRQDDSGRWSHKPNLMEARDCDEDGQPIVDIGRVNALDYKLCGIFETTRNARIR